MQIFLAVVSRRTYASFAATNLGEMARMGKLAYAKTLLLVQALMLRKPELF